jgi:hypothetical protein
LRNSALEGGIGAARFAAPGTAVPGPTSVLSPRFAKISALIDFRFVGGWWMDGF